MKRASIDIWHINGSFIIASYIDRDTTKLYLYINNGSMTILKQKNDNIMRRPLMTYSFDCFILMILRTARKLTNGVDISMMNIKLNMQSPKPPRHDDITIRPEILRR